MPRSTEGPTFISVEIGGVFKYFDSLLHLPLMIIVLFNKDLSVFQTYVMFGRRGVFG